MVSTLKSPSTLPPATLLLGPLESGKTKTILGQFSADSILIVPSRQHGLRIKRELAAAGKAFFAAGIHTFESISQKLLEDHGIYPPVLDDARRMWLLRKILGEMQEEKELRFLAGTRDNYGFLGALADFVKELKHAEIFYPQLEEGLRRKGPDPKDAEILELYARYQKDLLQHDAFDREGLLWQAKNILARGARIEGMQTLLVDGFDSFTPTQLSFLQNLAKTARQTTITLAMEQGAGSPPEFAHCRQTMQQLGTLFSLREEWLQAQPRTRDVALFEAKDLDSEVRWCAAQAKRLLSGGSGSLKPSDVAICVRRLDWYEDPLAQAMEQHGLPYTMLRSRPLTHTAVYRFLGSMIRAHTTKDAQELLGFLQSPLIADALNARGFPPADWIRRAFLEGGIDALSGDWPARLRWALRERIPRHPAALDALAENLQKLVAEFSQELVGQTAQQHRQNLIQRLSAWRIPQEQPNKWKQFSPSSFPQSFSGNPEDRSPIKALGDDELNYFNEWEAFWKMLDGYTAFHAAWCRPGPLMSLDEWWNDLFPFAQETELRENTEQEGIAVLEAHKMRGALFRAVFLLGLNEGLFPWPGPGSSLHSVGERRRMIEAGLELQDKGDAEKHRAEETFLFRKVTGAAEESLFASWHKANLQSQECLPSPFFLSLRGPQTSLRGAERRSNLEDPPWPSESPQQWACPQDALNAFASALFTPRSGRPAYHNRLETLWKSADSGRLQRLKERATVEYLRERRKSFSIWDAQMQNSRVLTEIDASLGLGSVTSASRLNEYAKCPFRFYARYALNIDPPWPSYREMTPALRGTLIHEILWTLYHGHFQTRTHPATVDAFAAIQKDLPQVVAKALDAFGKEYGILRAGVWEWEKQRLMNELEDLLKHEEAFFQKNPSRKPAFFELAFGMPGADRDKDPSSQEEPVELAGPSGALKIRGKIDRVDLESFPSADGKSRMGFWVLDYKSGAARIGKTDIEKGKDIQLPVYLLTAQQILQRLQIAAFPAGAALLKTWPPKMINSFVKNRKNLAAGKCDDPQWDSVLEKARDWISRYAKDISWGRFTPTPSYGKCVSHCAYRSACRFDERRIETKTSATPDQDDE